MKIEPQQKDRLRTDCRRIGIVLVAGFLMAININTFVSAGGLYPGGVSGLTVLIQRLCASYLDIQVPFTAINVALNAVPFYIGFRYLGRRFTLLSLLMVMASNILVDILPSPSITTDPLLTSVFGGILSGIAVGICLRENASSGGLDFIAIWLADKKGIDTYDMMMVFNAILYIVAGVCFGWDKALYSMIFQYVYTQVLHLLYQRYQHQTLLIITEYPYEVGEIIRKVCNHSSTILEGVGAYERKERYVVYSVVSKTDKSQVMKAVKKLDPKAFIDVLKTDELSGNFYYKPHE